MSKAQHITADEITVAAATGVARALEVRKAAGVELTTEDLKQVNGGASCSGGGTHGGIKVAQ